MVSCSLFCWDQTYKRTYYTLNLQNGKNYTSLTHLKGVSAVKEL
jgi:hypothetical protein